MPEANKIFKKDGIYYFLHNGCNFVGDDPIRKAWMMRSPCVYGLHPDGSRGTFTNPGRYEHCPFPIVEGFREPCQGNLVDVSTPGGTRWYFFTHHGKMGSLGCANGVLGVDGRPCSLLPVEWIDGWPVVSDANTQGRMIWKNLAKPFPHSVAQKPPSSDDFTGDTLGLQWLWNHQPRPDAFRLQEQASHLRLLAFRPGAPDRIDLAGNTLLQRMFRREKSCAIGKIDISGMADGQNAGLLHMAGSSYTALGVCMSDGTKILRYLDNTSTANGETIPETVRNVWLKSEWGYDAMNVFFYSFDGTHFLPFGSNRQLTGCDYRGDYVGFFSYNNLVEAGWIDIDFLQYDI
jgi:beta-xylosidase